MYFQPLHISATKATISADTAVTMMLLSTLASSHTPSGMAAQAARLIGVEHAPVGVMAYLREELKRHDELDRYHGHHHLGRAEQDGEDRRHQHGRAEARETPHQAGNQGDAEGGPQPRAGKQTRQCRRS